MATTVTVDADDVAYLAELAWLHVIQVRASVYDEAVLGPIFRAFLILEEQAPHTFAHQYDLWALAGQTDEEEVRDE